MNKATDFNGVENIPVEEQPLNRGRQHQNQRNRGFQLQSMKKKITPSKFIGAPPQQSNVISCLPILKA